MTNEEIEKLIEKAKKFSNFSFVPYSAVPQGACVLTADNLVFGGCAIENADFSCSVSAVEVAVLKAVSEGHNEIKAVAVYSNGKKMPYLTGSARQVVYQFGKDAQIIVATDEQTEVYSFYEMLPFAFEGEDE